MILEAQSVELERVHSFAIILSGKKCYQNQTNLD